ncbi:MAG: hypothetical protein Ct9H90mP14_2780 [Methanobacteriota archaeon]|nr:MAG: hypothetical protein Ct9H90mP14_2780 [Euryarchaeota archaeon]
MFYPVGEGEDIGGKARFAFPLEPGIALCLRVLAMGSQYTVLIEVFVRFVLAGRLSLTSEIHQIDSRLWPKRPLRGRSSKQSSGKMRELDSVFLIDESGNGMLNLQQLFAFFLALVSP